MDICFQLFIPLTGFHLWKCITWSIPDLTEDTEFWHRSVFLINSSTEPCWTYISGDPITQLRSRLFKPPRLSSRSSFSSLRLRLVGGGVFLSSWMERRSMLLYTCTKQKSPLYRESIFTLPGPLLIKGSNLSSQWKTFPGSMTVATLLD